MSDNVTATEIALFTSWGIPILSAIGGAVVGFILKFLWDKSQEKKRVRKEQLDKHFNEEIMTVTSLLIKIVEGTSTPYGTLEARNVIGTSTMDDEPFPLAFGFSHTTEYESFKNHYPNEQKLCQHLSIKIQSHNYEVEKAIKEVRQMIENDTELPPIKKHEDIVAEKILPEAATLLYKTMYLISIGRDPYDSSVELKEVDEYPWRILAINNNQILRSESESVTDIGGKLVGNNIKVGKYKKKLLEIQNSVVLKDKAQKISEDAFKLYEELLDLKNKLELISKHGRNSFKREKKCTICRDYIK